MRTNIDKAVQALRTLNPAGVKGWDIRQMAVCGHPENRGDLPDETWLPYLAAADLKHDTYMRWRSMPMPAGTLHSTVVVNEVIVAWLQYDGMPRVVEGTFTQPLENTVRDLARTHLGAEPEVQQRLADERADIEKMSADAFPGVIGEFAYYTRPGSKFNDFPLDMTVREWSHLRLTERRAATGQQFPFVPNPTRELTDEERHSWWSRVDEYTAAFKRRFPAESEAWEFRKWWNATREERYAAGSLDLRAGERVLIEDHSHNVLLAAVVAWRLRENSNGSENVHLFIEPDHPSGDEKEYLRNVVIHPGCAMRHEDVPRKSRHMWRDAWTALARMELAFREEMEK